MNGITSKEVRQFLVARYSEKLSALGLEPADVPGDFDFFVQGINVAGSAA